MLLYDGFFLLPSYGSSCFYSFVPQSQVKSFSSAWKIDKNAKIKEITVSTAETTTLFAIVKSPILACVKRISRKDATIVALDDFIFIPINREMKLMVTMVIDFTSN